MGVKVTLRMSEEDAARMEQAIKDGKLKEFGIEWLGEVPEKRIGQWLTIPRKTWEAERRRYRPHVPLNQGFCRGSFQHVDD